MEKDVGGRVGGEVVVQSECMVWERKIKKKKKIKQIVTKSNNNRISKNNKHTQN